MPTRDTSRTTATAISEPTGSTPPTTPPQANTAPAVDPLDSTPFALLGARRRTVAALDRLGIETPTLIQTRAIPPLLAGRDVVGQSRTGSGKTIAFGLPLVERIDPRLRQVQALVLVPTRELATQVAEVLAALDGGRGLRVAQLIGGRALGPQRDTLRQGAQIAVGAPGRVLDHLRQGNLNLSALRVAVLDEADQMLDAGFAPDVERILAMTPPTRQLALFTATLPEWTTRIAQRYLHDPIRVDADSPDIRPAPPIEQTLYRVPQGQRLEALMALLDRRRNASGSTLVFGRTKHGVKKLARQLEARGYPVAALQGNMSQPARERVIADFRAGTVPVLLATNVAARGIDVRSIELVINYELPESAELFTHRIGRTGRMDEEGEAITLITPEDLAAWQKIQRALKVQLRMQPWPQREMPLPAPSPTDTEASSDGYAPRPSPAPRAFRGDSARRPARPQRMQSQQPQRERSRPGGDREYSDHGDRGDRGGSGRFDTVRR
ncbi:MAG: DEAD/DEAH box helicase [Ktedonobacterales bacterium]